MNESARTLEIRAARAAKFPVEFEVGYVAGYTGNHQKPCDMAGYPLGFHAWPLERKNAWYAGFNLGDIESEAGRG